MSWKSVFVSALLVLTIGMFGVTLFVQRAKATVDIYIRADGSVDPPTAPITRVGNVYTFTGNIYGFIYVEKDNIIIDGAGFTVQVPYIVGTGLTLSERSNVTIKNMEITSFYTGIQFYTSSNNTISNNTITSCSYCGISLRYSCDNNTICGNRIANISGMHTVAIFIERSSGNKIVGNHVTENNYTGIELELCPFSTVSENQVTGNGGVAVSLSGSNSCASGNNITANAGGIGSSSDCSIYGNHIAENLGAGIVVGRNNNVSGNNVTGNRWGMFLGGTGSVISGNYITANYEAGIYISQAPYNVIHHNSFKNNSIQVFVYDVSPNLWDDGYPSGGNYWSDYTGVDANHDGIGDSDYVIDENNIDHYPLMGMFSEFNATSEYSVQTVCDAAIADFRFNGTAISFNVTGEEGTTGFCRVCVPTALMNDTYRVFVNGTEVSHTLLPCSNSTHSYLYFTYTHSTQEVIIVPEFPSFLILPLFMIATLLAAILYRKKHSM